MNTPGAPASPSLYAVELRSTNWAGLVRWYRDVLGLARLVRVPEDQYALFSAGEARVTILGRDEVGLPSERICLAFETDDIYRVARQISAAGSDVRGPWLNAEGYRELLTTDPDGNRIRVFQWPH